MMNICRLPQRVLGVLFDMDMTLYTHPDYAQFQIDALIRRLADLRGVSFEEMGERIAACRRDWAASHNGAAVSLGNVFTAFGISTEESVRWREELCEPARYLREDPKLRERLVSLRAFAGLAVVTNNPVLVARKTLTALGVIDCFSAVVGLDTCGVSKPHPAPFLKAAELLGAHPASCVSIGDRYDIDIALPLELGMGGIVVDGVEDVYEAALLLAAPATAGR